MSEPKDYVGREQTLVKHTILKNYLERFAHIVGSRWNSITYIDCFSGPWQAQSEELEDTSFSIALDMLRRARETHLKRNHDLQLRAYFLEKDPTAYARLGAFADKVDDVEIATRNGELAGAIDDIVGFVNKARPPSFPFVFIDPTGWTGFGMETIAPLLRLRPGEVLINLMIEHIRRFIESPHEQTAESFADLFGSSEFRHALRGLHGQDREDAVVREYRKNVRRTGGFPYVCPAVVLNPQTSRTHYWLIYATRSPTGVDVFKQSEKGAMSMMEEIRAEAQQRQRLKTTKQRELLTAEQTHDPTCFRFLRDRYLGKAREAVVGLLQSGPSIQYDALWKSIVPFPLVWESDLKVWLQEWCTDGRLQYEGFKPRQRVPKRGKGILVRWTAGP